MILDNVDNAKKACLALSVVYDDPTVTELRVFNLGDGEALSGLLVASHQKNTDASTFLVFLLD